jgi:hypothetical protein
MTPALRRSGDIKDPDMSAEGDAQCGGHRLTIDLAEVSAHPGRPEHAGCHQLFEELHWRFEACRRCAGMSAGLRRLQFADHKTLRLPARVERARISERHQRDIIVGGHCTLGSQFAEMSGSPRPHLQTVRQPGGLNSIQQAGDRVSGDADITDPHTVECWQGHAAHPSERPTLILRPAIRHESKQVPQNELLNALDKHRKAYVLATNPMVETIREIAVFMLKTDYFSQRLLNALADQELSMVNLVDVALEAEDALRGTDLGEFPVPNHPSRSGAST